MTTAVAATPRRELESLTAASERRLLLALAARVPKTIGPDHLTALGFAGMALAACTRGTFKLSYGPLGGTELRLLLAAANTLVWFVPRVEVAGRAVLVFDLLGAGALAAVAAVVLGATAGTARALGAQERP